MSGENQTARLEHVNLTVSDPRATAAMLEAVFGWRVRWEGASIGGGFTMHVGGAGDYVALYTPPEPPAAGGNSYATVAALNHIGVVVDDLDAVEARVVAQGFTPVNHGDYEPGRRFYFRDADAVEWEVVSYG